MWKLWKLADEWHAPLALQDYVAEAIFMYAKIWFSWQTYFIMLTFALQMFFFSQKYLVDTVNLLTMADIAVECAWLFSIIS